MSNGVVVGKVLVEKLGVDPVLVYCVEVEPVGRVVFGRVVVDPDVAVEELNVGVVDDDGRVVVVVVGFDVDDCVGIIVVVVEADVDVMSKSGLSQHVYCISILFDTKARLRVKDMKMKLTYSINTKCHILTSPTGNRGHFISDLPCRQATEKLLAINGSRKLVGKIELVASPSWTGGFSRTANSRVIRPNDCRIHSNELSNWTIKKNAEKALTFLDQIFCSAFRIHRA